MVSRNRYSIEPVGHSIGHKGKLHCLRPWFFGDHLRANGQHRIECLCDVATCSDFTLSNVPVNHSVNAPYSRLVSRRDQIPPFEDSLHRAPILLPRNNTRWIDICPGIVHSGRIVPRWLSQLPKPFPHNQIWRHAAREGQCPLGPFRKSRDGGVDDGSYHLLLVPELVSKFTRSDSVKPDEPVITQCGQ